MNSWLLMKLLLDSTCLGILMVQKNGRLRSLTQLLLTAVLVVLHHILNLLLIAPLPLAVRYHACLTQQNVVIATTVLFIVALLLSVRHLGQIVGTLYDLYYGCGLRVLMIAALHAALTLSHRFR